jgi:hypothetical protein
MVETGGNMQLLPANLKSAYDHAWRLGAAWVGQGVAEALQRMALATCFSLSQGPCPSQAAPC